jgi:5-oxoprolinase (ATP-hydrolysing) subunit A
MIIDINCDLGEITGTGKTGNDDSIMQYITSANIACGFHAGDPVTIMRAIQSAISHGVTIGAHPGYPDKEGFGRKSMILTNDELRASVIYQVGAIKSMAESAGGRLSHVKPHGALYNSAAADFEMAIVIARAIKEIDSSLTLMGLSGSQLIRAAEEIGLVSASEVFGDRAYNDDGSLVSRDLPGAVLHETKEVIDRVVKMIEEGKVETISGKTIPIKAETICIHGDNEMALEFVRTLSSVLRERGIMLKSITRR